MPNKTVIVIGAGASKECGLPTGDEMKADIARLLNFRFSDNGERRSGDQKVLDALRSISRTSGNPGGVSPYLDAARHISAALPLAISIDNFVDAHRGNGVLELVSKVAIAKAVLDGERTSKMWNGEHWEGKALKAAELDGTWYPELMKRLTEGNSWNDLVDRLSGLTLVVFNYDRCIEHFVFSALKIYYKVSDDDAALAIERIKIIHPYGSVGPLRWQRGADNIEFGGAGGGDQLVKSASKIRTFTQGTDPKESEIVELRDRFLAADTVLFLGFAYHQMNLNVLRPGRPHAVPTGVRYIGTAFGMSHSNAESVRNDLINLASVNAAYVTVRSDLTCSRLFIDYSRDLLLV